MAASLNQLPNGMRKHLEKVIRRFAERYRKNKKYPATVIAAWQGGWIHIESSGPVPNPLSVQLFNKLLAVGVIGSRFNNNILGCCSEVRSPNTILLVIPTLSVQRINFTNAYRPRTMQVISRCQNCALTFR